MTIVVIGGAACLGRRLATKLPRPGRSGDPDVESVVRAAVDDGMP